MTKEALSDGQKRADTDLTIICTATLLPLIIYAVFGGRLMSYCRSEEVSPWLGIAAGAAVQFGLTGLGMSIVLIFRRESLRSYGLILDKALLTVLLSILVFLPQLIFMILTRQVDGYLPFQGVLRSREILAAPFPLNLLGYAGIALIWGFFEGFNYVVISRKINDRFPTDKWWLNWGAIFCAVACILIHGMIGVGIGIFLEALTTFILIYGMLVIKDYTRNAWGCIFIFLFLWNSF